MVDKHFINFKERIKDLGSLSTHDGVWRDTFEKNGFKWREWWGEFCDGWYDLIGLNRSSSFRSSIFNKKGEDLLARWIYFGDIKYLEPFYEWFNEQMDIRLKESLLEKQSSDKESKNTTISGFVYLIKSNALTKIGRAKQLKNRFKTYVTENPNKIKLIFQKKVKDYKKTEKFLHEMFESKNIRSEWFKLDKKDIVKAKKFLNSCP